MSVLLKADNVTVCYGNITAVDHVSTELKDGEWLMLCGPNGAGKTTFAKALSRQVAFSGNIEIMGKRLRDYKQKELAKKIAVLSQMHNETYDFTVEEIVSMGRYAYRGGMLGERDRNGNTAVEKALHITGIESMRYKSILNMSGGEVQRVYLAQVFAQEPQILILDEPANHLDLMYQKQVFDLIAEWVNCGNRAVVSVVHDLSLAKRYGNTAMLMNRGKVVSTGRVDKALDSETLREVYGMDVREWMHSTFQMWE